MATREADVVDHLIACRTLDDLLFFTDRGKVYQLKAHEVPDASRTAKGLPLVNLISLEPQEQVTTVLNVPSFDDADYLVMATVRGKIKRTNLADYSSVRSNGLIAIGLEEGDELRWVRMSKGSEDILLTSCHGQTIRFHQDQVRPMGRPASGVIGMNLDDDDRIISMDLAVPDRELLVVTTRGFGKRTALQEYPVKGRAGGGVITIKLRPDDEIAAAQVVAPNDALTLISRQGIVMRTTAGGISRMGRSTQGVIVMSLNDGDAVAALSVEGPQEDESNPNIMATAEVVEEAATNGKLNGRSNGNTPKVS
jgi:DNA gyrase subunit A